MPYAKRYALFYKKMREITIEIESNQEIWELFDKDLNNIFIPKFNPHEVIEWWETDLKIKSGVDLRGLKVRNLTFDLHTDLDGLKKLIDLNTSHISIFQFDKPVPDTLIFEQLPESSRNSILKQNGLRHNFWIHHEFITISSFDDDFVESIKKNPIFQNRIK